jgi:hypothetical protein
MYRRGKKRRQNAWWIRANATTAGYHVIIQTMKKQDHQNQLRLT